MRRPAVALLVLLAVLSAVAVQRRTRVHAQVASYAAGWNLVAGPQGAHLVGATGSLYTLQPGDTTYETRPIDTPLTACVGYWAYFPTGGSIDFGPFGGASVQCSLNVSPAQYVMMGNPSASANVNVNGADVVYTYDPASGYQPATRLAPGQGAWVYAAGGVSIQAAPPPLRPPQGAASAANATETPTAAAAPLALSAALSVSTCTGGAVGVTVTVVDASGAGVAGATVTGTVIAATGSRNFSFPPTDENGVTSTSVDTGALRGGYTVQWLFTASANGLSASGMGSCFAP
ncbi:MAG TPA: hypothetical protein VFD32_17280 [Dehalococcoidia bacterium]|nr:hypothetical protein [Dehalococcoidia bacterium]